MTVFQEKVWKRMSEIPRGKVVTYQDLAVAVNAPRACRAVGHACNLNPQAPVVPCHRVVAAGGRIGGYAFGLAKKIALLKLEGVVVRANKVQDFEQKRFKFR